jgi:hypothetical protein
VFHHAPPLIRCEGCGVPYHDTEDFVHECVPEQWAAHQFTEAHCERFETELTAWLGSTRGRFDVWYAEHRRP